jgi:hypothetical protein
MNSTPRTYTPETLVYIRKIEKCLMKERINDNWVPTFQKIRELRSKRTTEPYSTREYLTLIYDTLLDLLDHHDRIVKTQKLLAA